MSSGANKVSDSTTSRRRRPARRGDFVTIALSGDFGKPRPALILQADQFAGTATVTVLLVSSSLVEAPLLRVTVHPDAQNGLRSQSQVMVDKAMTVKREKLGQVFGHIDSESLLEIERCLAVFLGVAK
ncbi:MAG: type II toxin-antitoxin system PemK/MazF family toxin [Pseudomonadota bacterium]|jgi:mRNA interferase MazF|nr:type II toxin-antitoxin system PemK/MazF family toxin [Pseudomonadota bacterium]